MFLKYLNFISASFNYISICLRAWNRKSMHRKTEHDRSFVSLTHLQWKRQKVCKTDHSGSVISCCLLLVQWSLQMLPSAILQNQHTKGLKPCDSVITRCFPIMTSKRNKSVSCQIPVLPVSWLSYQLLEHHWQFLLIFLTHYLLPLLTTGGCCCTRGYVHGALCQW